jgi:predicted kinase
MAGLPGTGKSTLARALAGRLHGAVLDKDVIRAALFAPELVEYSQTQDDFCQEVMLQTAAYLLRRDPSRVVLLDGRTFSRRYQRERAVAFCGEIGTDWRMIECVCAPATAVARLERDAAAGSHPAANRTPALYDEVRAAWEEIGQPRMVVETDGPIEECVDAALGYLATAEHR